MKAHELMIKDWVEYGGYITTVRQLNFDEIILSGCVGRLAEVYPVPLTPEILEKNGFHECVGNDCEWRYERMYFDTGIHVVVSKNETCEEAGIRISIGLGETKWGARHALNLYNKQYVHELQHALKLCGIEEFFTL